MAVIIDHGWTASASAGTAAPSGQTGSFRAPVDEATQMHSVVGLELFEWSYGTSCQAEKPNLFNGFMTSILL